MNEPMQTYPLFSIDHSTVILTLQELDWFSLSSSTAKNPQTEILAVLDGKAILSTGSGEKISVSEGDVLFFDSMQEHRFVSSDSIPPFRVLSLRFDLRAFLTEDCHVFEKKTLDTFFLNVHNGNNCIPADSRSARKIINALFEMEEAFAESSEQNAPVIKSLTILLFSLVVRHYNELLEPTPLRKIQHYDDIQRTMVYINSHLQDSLSLEELAAVANMNKTYYSTLFKKITGMTVWDYILNARVELAITYLVKDRAEYSITEILGMCGFNNAATFNKTFKKVTGKTPSEYKNSKYNSCFSE